MICKSENGRTFGIAAILFIALLMSAVSATAQLTIGDNISMKIDGSVGFGYGGSFGNNDSQSTRGQALNFNGNVVGHYFHPNFLSFDFHPYFNKQSSVTDFNSTSRSTGFGASLSLFGGSPFPVSVSYGRDNSSSKDIQIGGVTSAIGSGSGRSFGITGAMLFPDWPQLYASYSDTNSETTLNGASQSNTSKSKTLNLNTTYNWAGFDIHGTLTRFSHQYVAPQFLTGDVLTGGGTGMSYSAGASHKIPLGSASMGWSRSTYSNGENSSGATSSLFGTAGINPWSRMSLNQSFTYTTNLSAALAQSILGSDGLLVVKDNDLQSSAMLMLTSSTFTLNRFLTAAGHMSRRIQTVDGRTISDMQYGGTLNSRYSHRLFGMLYFSGGVVDTVTKQGNANIGMVGSVSMNKKFGKWETAADFNYNQNELTLGSIRTTSTYNFGGNFSRKINKYTYWSSGYRQSRSGITVVEGSHSGSQSYYSSFSWKKYSVSGNYSQSQGAAVVNALGGLTPTPVGDLFADNIILFNGRSYGMSAGARLRKNLSVSGSYSNFASASAFRENNNFANGGRYSFRAEYKLRRFNITGAFDRSLQATSIVPGGPRVVNSYTINVSRWFSVF